MTDKPKAPRFERRVPPCVCVVASLRPAPAVQCDTQAPLDRSAAKPSFDISITLDAHSCLVRYVQWCFGETAEDQIHELYQGLLKRALPTLILTDHGPAVRTGRKGSGGDVRRRKNRNA
jgi:hypothetical protein